jgi:LmbE family N-acetylglucosaminyl deacetylase
MDRALMMFGVNTKPVMPRFKDMSGLQPWGKPDPAFRLWGGREKVVGFLVSQIRRFKPDVVVSMAVNGFNGNPQHMAASRGTVLACEASGDKAQFTEQLGKYGAWEPKKVYLHAADDESYETVHTHDWELECGGRPDNARILAARGNVLHESQEIKEECPASTKFVLMRTTVGPDVAGKNNLFENMD